MSTAALTRPVGFPSRGPGALTREALERMFAAADAKEAKAKAAARDRASRRLLEATAAPVLSVVRAIEIEPDGQIDEARGDRHDEILFFGVGRSPVPVEPIALDAHIPAGLYFLSPVTDEAGQVAGAPKLERLVTEHDGYLGQIRAQAQQAKLYGPVQTWKVAGKVDGKPVARSYRGPLSALRTLWLEAEGRDILTEAGVLGSGVLGEADLIQRA